MPNQLGTTLTQAGGTAYISYEELAELANYKPHDETSDIE